MNFNDVAIVSAGRSDYRIHFWYVNMWAKMIQQIWWKMLIEMKKVDYYQNFFLNIKMSLKLLIIKEKEKLC